MYHFAWQWSYTLIAVCAFLSPFAQAGVMLLRRSLSSLRRHRHTPTSISTKYGDFPMWDVNTQKMFAQGLQRARTREYYNPRGER